MKDVAAKIRDLVRSVGRAEGWKADMGRNGHWRIVGPKGQVVSLPKTPSDPRALLNARSRLRRAGASLPSRRPPHR